MTASAKVRFFRYFSAKRCPKFWSSFAFSLFVAMLKTKIRASTFHCERRRAMLTIMHVLGRLVVHSENERQAAKSDTPTGSQRDVRKCGHIFSIFLVSGFAENATGSDQIKSTPHIKRTPPRRVVPRLKRTPQIKGSPPPSGTPQNLRVPPILI